MKKIYLKPETKHTGFGPEQIICSSPKVSGNSAKTEDNSDGPIMEGKRRNMFDSDENSIW